MVLLMERRIYRLKPPCSTCDLGPEFCNENISPSSHTAMEDDISLSPTLCIVKGRGYVPVTLEAFSLRPIPSYV